MPNLANIRSPLVVIGCGRTASTYVQQRLQFGQGSFASVIENDVYRDVWDAVTDRWWTPSMKHVAPPDECRRRAVDATRQVLLSMFPSDREHWVMKMIWGKHDPAVVQQLFPEARFLHMVRDPRTNVPSMMERLQFRQRHAESTYVESNECAMQFEQFAGRYLRVRQEDLVLHHEQTWTRICNFVGVRDPSASTWNQEVNPSPSTKGSVGKMRSDTRLTWRKLSKRSRAYAVKLGYAESSEPTANLERSTPMVRPAVAAPLDARARHCQ